MSNKSETRWTKWLLNTSDSNEVSCNLKDVFKSLRDKPVVSFVSFILFHSIAVFNR